MKMRTWWSTFGEAFAHSVCLAAVGPQPTGDGNTPPTGRQAKTGDTVVCQAHGKYYEDASRGVVFGASDNASGVTVTTSLGTTAIVSLHNPINTKTRVVPVKLRLVYFSGTMPAGGFYHCFLAPGVALPSAGTAPTIYTTDAGYEAGAAAQAVFRYGPTVVTPSSTNALILPACSSFVELATTANAFQVVELDFDGEFVLEPQAQYQLQGVFGAGGSSPKVSVGMSWKEIPYVASQG